MRTQSDHAQVSRLIKKQLKSHDIKCRTRSSSFSGGTSVDVTILDDILPATYEAIKSYCAQYEYGHFDGMTDCYEYSNSRDDIPQVKFLHVSLEYSTELQSAAWEHCKQYYQDCSEFSTFENANWNAQRTYQRVLDGTGDHGGFWTSRKRRVKGV